MISKEPQINKNEDPLLFAVGDIHGCYENLILMIQEICSRRYFNYERDKIILLGNYVDEGSRTNDVIRYVRTLINQNGIVALQGGRDFLMCKSNKAYFKSHLSAPTIKSYRTSTLAPFNARDFNRFDVVQFKKDRDFLKTLPFKWESNKFYFVSSGVDPNKDLTSQTKPATLFIKDRFDESNRVFPKTIVHGNRPSKKVHIAKNRNRINVDLDCPNTGRLACAVLNDTTGEMEEVLVVNGEDYEPVPRK